MKLKIQEYDVLILDFNISWICGYLTNKRPTTINYIDLNKLIIYKR